MAEDDPGPSRIKLAREAPFRLGGVDIYPATRQIVRDGRSETLEPRIMQVLVALARAEGAILSRDELVDQCWSGRIVGDNAIHRAVSKVRELGLNFADGAFRLETITKVGYRMIVPARANLAPAAIDAVPPPVSPPSRRTLIGGTAAGLAVAAVGATWIATRPSGDDRVATLIAQGDRAIGDALPDSDAQGIAYFREAVRIAPGNALAWGRLALAQYRATDNAAPDRARALAAATQEAARRALALDPRQPDALAAVALLPPYYGDWLAAEKRMTSVLAVDPGHLATRSALGFFHVAVGRARVGALSHVAVARRAPLDALYQYRSVYAYWVLGAIPAADRAADRTLQLWPKHPGAWFSKLWVLAFTGRADRALAHLSDTAIRPAGLPPPLLAALDVSMRALVSRRRDDADRAGTALVGLLAKGPANSVNAIMILNALGDVDRAFAVAEAYLLERGALIASLDWRAGQPSVNDQHHRKTNMLFMPVSAPMRADPRFRRLAEDIGLADYWRRAAVEPDFAGAVEERIRAG
ncbi:MAG: winged helix-turn-helix domain-containing protein [Pseudomonadota bacterium]